MRKLLFLLLFLLPGIARADQIVVLNDGSAATVPTTSPATSEEVPIPNYHPRMPRPANDLIVTVGDEVPIDSSDEVPAIQQAVIIRCESGGVDHTCYVAVGCGSNPGEVIPIHEGFSRRYDCGPDEVHVILLRDRV